MKDTKFGTLGGKQRRTMDRVRLADSGVICISSGFASGATPSVRERPVHHDASATERSPSPSVSMEISGPGFYGFFYGDSSQAMA